MRWLLRLLLLAALAAGWWWLRQHDGQLHVEWQGYAFRPRLSTLLPVLLVLWWLITRMDRLWCWLKALGDRSGRWMSLHQQQAALEQVVDGFTALAAGDLPEASRLSRRLDKRLRGASGPLQPLYHMFAAQVAQQTGQEADAATHYEAMQQTPSGKFLGMRGTLAIKRREIVTREPNVPAADYDALLALAEEAYRLKPKAPWAALALFEAHVLKGQLTEAQRILHRSRGKSLDRLDYDRLMAVADYLQARHAQEAGDTATAIRHAAKACQRRPGFIPAVLLLAEGWLNRGEPEKARKVLRQAWGHQPHPELAARYLATLPAREASRRYKLGQQLVKSLPAHAASQLLLTELAYEMHDNAAAWAHAIAAWNRNHSWTAWQWLQRLREEERRIGGATEPLPHAPHMSDDPAWRCQRCSAVHSQWHLHCRSCASLDSIRWDMPHAAPLLNETSLLLLAGQ